MEVKTRKLLHLSFLVAAGTALHIFEGMLPALSVLPGAKLGLANLVNLIALSFYGAGSAWWVVILRVFLGSLLGGTLLTTTFFLSSAGALGSMLVMIISYSGGRGPFSLMGVSVLGAVAHNLSQLLMATVLIQRLGIFFYLPYLLAFALPTGYFVGLTATYVGRYFPAKNGEWKKPVTKGVSSRALNT